MKSAQIGLNGSRMKAIREKRGFTQEDLANLLQLPQQQISRWEGGKVDPSGEALVRISTILGVSADYLLGLVDEPNEYLAAPEEQISPMERRLLWALKEGLIGEALETFTTLAKGKQ